MSIIDIVNKNFSQSGIIIPLLLVTVVLLGVLGYVVISSKGTLLDVKNRVAAQSTSIGIGTTASVGVGDTNPPTVTVTNPVNGFSVSGTVKVSAEASDSGGIANVSFYADGSSLGIDTTAPYSVLWDTTVYPHNSLHTIIANALDTAGNQASSSAVAVTVLDIIAPSVVITNPVNGSTVPKNSTVTITANASDVSGINRVEFYVNGVLKCTDTTSSYLCNWKVPKRPNITYTLLAKGYDIAGNTNTSTVTVTSK